MLHPLVLIIVLCLVGYDAFGAFTDSPVAGFGALLGLMLGSLLAIGVAVHLTFQRVGRWLDRSGSMRAMRIADATLSVSRLLIGAAFIVFVFLFDWIGAVRAAVGDWIGIDEVIVSAPPLLAYAAGWWSFFPIDRRLHDAAMLRAIDTGRPVHAFPARGAYTWEKLRYSMLAALVPLALILLWGETVTIGAARLDLLPWPADDERSMLALAGLQLVGAAAVLIASPPILLALWDTTPLPEGELRSRLMAMCRRHRVRTGGIRIWNTRGVILNGAVVGVLPRLRYVLLTDALVESLPAHEVDAVMAHEVGHVRRRHLPWLLGALIASLGLATWALSWGLSWLDGGGESPWAPGGILEAGAFVIAIVVAFAIFGVASRTFEREADAFAVQDASGLASGASAGGREVTPLAAESMAGALESVARLNHIPRDKFSWRHGSIADRCRRIRSLVGQSIDRLPSSRAARRMRLAIAAGLAMFGAATLFDVWIWTQSSPDSHTPNGAALAAHADDSIHEDARHRE